MKCALTPHAHVRCGGDSPRGTLESRREEGLYLRKVGKRELEVDESEQGLDLDLR